MSEPKITRMDDENDCAFIQDLFKLMDKYGIEAATLMVPTDSNMIIHTAIQNGSRWSQFVERFAITIMELDWCKHCGALLSNAEADPDHVADQTMH